MWNDCRYICKLTWIIHAFKTFLWSNKSEMQIIWFYCNVSKMNFTCDAWWTLHVAWYMFVKSQCSLLLNLFRIMSIFHFFKGIQQKIGYSKVSIFFLLLFLGILSVVSLHVYLFFFVVLKHFQIIYIYYIFWNSKLQFIYWQIDFCSFECINNINIL